MIKKPRNLPKKRPAPAKSKILGLSIFLSLIFSAPLLAQTLPEFHEEEKKLDAQIRQALVLVAEPNQPKLGGMNPKCLLVDQLGRRWMFKMHKETFLDTIEEVSLDVGHLIGLKLPQVYVMKLPINGKPTQGTLHQWFDNAIDLEKTPASMLNEGQTNFLLKQQIYDYLIANFDVQPENFLWLRATGEVFGIDKDYAFDRYGEEMPLALKPGAEHAYVEDYYMETWQNYTQKRAQVDFGSLLEIVSYAAACDEMMLQKMVEPAFKLDYVKKHLKGMPGFMERKRGLAKSFLALYQEARKARGESPLPEELPSPEIYEAKVKESYQNRLQQKKKELEALLQAKKGNQQSIQVTLQARPDSGIEVLTPDQLQKILYQPKEQAQ